MAIKLSRIRPSVEATTKPPAGTSEAADESAPALCESVALLHRRAEHLQCAVVVTLAEACTALLAPAGTVAASYRMTGKPMPTAPSFFDASVLWARCASFAMLQWTGSPQPSVRLGV
jgi:hypothetical protein